MAKRSNRPHARYPHSTSDPTYADWYTVTVTPDNHNPLNSEMLLKLTMFIAELKIEQPAVTNPIAHVISALVDLSNVGPEDHATDGLTVWPDTVTEDLLSIQTPSIPIQEVLDDHRADLLAWAQEDRKIDKTVEQPEERTPASPPASTPASPPAEQRTWEQREAELRATIARVSDVPLAPETARFLKSTYETNKRKKPRD